MRMTIFLLECAIVLLHSESMPTIRINNYETIRWENGDATFHIAIVPDGRCFILIPSAGGNGKGTHNQNRNEAILWIQDRANALGFKLFDIHKCHCARGNVSVSCGDKNEIKSHDLRKGIEKLVYYSTAPLAFTFDGLTGKMAEYLCGEDGLLEDVFLEKSLVKLEEEREEAKKVYFSKTRARDATVREIVRERDNYKCQYGDCGNSFDTPAGMPYVEVHHLELFSHGGEDTPANMVCLCAHHHAMIHYADVQTCTRMTRELRELVRGKQ